MSRATENIKSNSMSGHANTIININTTPEEHSRETIAFQKKIQKIEKLESSNKKLHETLSSIQMEVMEMAAPIVKELCNERIKNLTSLEAQFKLAFFKKNEKEKIRQLILQGSHELYNFYSDERGKRIYDKFTDPEEKEAQEEAFSAFEDLFTDLGNQIDSENENDTSFDDSFDTLTHEEHIEPKKRRTKTKAHQEKAHQEKVNLESKTIYRKLMKTLHPDLELNEDKKSEKNEVTQKVVEAYKNNNIYELLKLRSEYLDQSVSDHDIKLYAQELNKRIHELNYEKHCIKNGFRDIYEHFYSRSKKKIKEKIKNEQRKLRKDIRNELYHQKFFSDKQKLRKFLREEISLSKKTHFPDDLFFDLLGEMFNRRV